MDACERKILEENLQYMTHTRTDKIFRMYRPDYKLSRKKRQELEANRVRRLESEVKTLERRVEWMDKELATVRMQLEEPDAVS